MKESPLDARGLEGMVAEDVQRRNLGVGGANTGGSWVNRKGASQTGPANEV